MFCSIYVFAYFFHARDDRFDSLVERYLYNIVP